MQREENLSVANLDWIQASLSRAAQFLRHDSTPAAERALVEIEYSLEKLTFGSNQRPAPSSEKSLSVGSLLAKHGFDKLPHVHANYVVAISGLLVFGAAHNFQSLNNEQFRAISPRISTTALRVAKQIGLITIEGDGKARVISFTHVAPTSFEHTGLEQPAASGKAQSSVS